MAPNREDRRKERQRGAGTRQIKNTGFDLALPGQENAVNPPLEPRKSGRRKTPQPELLRPQRSTRRTPAPEDLLSQQSTRRIPAPENQPQRSSQRTPATGITKKRGKPRQDAAPEARETSDVPISSTRKHHTGKAVSKRRNLYNATGAPEGAEAGGGAMELEVQVKDSQTLESDVAISSTRSVKKRKKRKSIGQQSMKTKPPKVQTPPKFVQIPQKGVPKSKPGLPIEPSHEELRVQAQVHGLPFGGEKHPLAPEVTEARDFAAEVADADLEKNTGGEQLKSRKRKRVSIGQQSKKRSKPTSAKQTKDIVPQGGIAVAEHMTDTSQSQDEAAEDVADAANEAIEARDRALEAAEIQIRQKGKRKKRKSIGQQRPKRKSTESASLGSPAREKAHAAGVSGLDKTKRAAAAFRCGAAGSKNPVDENVQIEVESISEAAEAPAVVPKFPEKRGPSKRDKIPQDPTITKAPKAPQRRKANSKSVSKPAKAASPQIRNPSSNSIPITIYGPPSLASSNSGMSDVEDDPLANAQALPSVKTINPVDVLSQICREMIHKTSNTLAERAQENAERRGDFKRKKRTVEMYGEELNARLLQLTKTLNTNNALTTRLRDATREAKSLKKEIKAIEDERERVKLEKEEALKAMTARELEEMLRGIADAVKKGWEMHAMQERGGSVLMT